MKFGIIGLGKMGLAIAKRTLSTAKVFAYDTDETARKAAQEVGIKVVDTISEIAKETRIIWIMVPAGKPVDDVLEELKPDLKLNDIIIDGGNSHFEDSKRRFSELEKIGINFIDCGTSGGVHGEEIGFCLMVGGKVEIFQKLKPLFDLIATKDGYEHVGESGAGHYIKMVHNGIEYALLESYAEGFHLLRETKEYQNLNLAKIANVWTNGSIVRSWILKLCKEVFQKDQFLKNISGAIGENKTGMWTSIEAHKQNVEVPLIDESLKIREWSRTTGGDFGTKVVAMLRHEFGGHPLIEKSK